MPDSRFLVGFVGGAAAVFVLVALATHLVSREESTTALDAHDTVLVEGHRALAPGTVAGRTQSLYHPLPWVGSKVHVTCPTGLKAVTGARLTCTGRRGDGTTVDIPVRVVRVSGASLTWRFER
ncbi:DUF4333 domain-containing protein [Streptomyces sp. NBC_01334]|uniref:DUF4333 domain-containing protein n=1 Tax=Streptomyces sp. NBC_01334 TaxID=2903827 RepID=UPI002E13A4F3|nr:DUF4333 domain-containing protein [Streptomyces sp. NBC_01334]